MTPPESSSPVVLHVRSDQWDGIFPFGLVTDAEGTLLHIGRSIRKVFPSLAVGRGYSEYFEVHRPTGLGDRPRPERLVGDLLLLGPRDDMPTAADLAPPDMRLRGQVIRSGTGEEQFLFLLRPSLTSPDRITSWNLDFSDFPVGDSIFDFLMLLSSERTARAKTEGVLARLQWEHRLSDLLHRVSVAASDLSDIRPAIELVLREVCLELSWNIGHAFIVNPEDPEELVSSGIWYRTDAERYLDFVRVTEATVVRKGKGFVGSAHETGQLQWLDDVRPSEKFRRRAAFQGFPPVFGVALPVHSEGKVVAVLEFFAEREQRVDQNLLRFFDTVSRQMTTVLERQQSVQREQEQLAVMTMSAKLASLGAMAAGVGHEVNNPLTAILLGTQQMLEIAHEGEVNRAVLERGLQRTLTAAERIARIVASLKTFSRESSRDPMVDTTLDRIVEDTLQLCEARFRQSNVRLERVPPRSPVALRCRAVEISQVLLNLLSNAFDAVVGQPMPWVRLEWLEHDDTVDLVITDSGTGIPETVAARMMSPFFTTKEVGRGTGLGLSISARIVDAHDGTLTLDRTSRNTRFVVRLPRGTPRG